MSRGRERKRDWTLLPEGIVDCIGDLLLEEDVTEYIHLRRVCASWRHATLNRVLTDPRFHPRNWIFISQFENRNDFCFLNLSTGKYIRAHVPHNTANHIFVRVVDGLLVFYDDASRVIYLLDPFTGARISLPPLHLVVYRNDIFSCFHTRIDHAPIMRKLVLSIQFALPSSAFTVAITFSHAIALAKPGDTKWSFIQMKRRYLVQSFQNQLYLLCDIDGHILRLDQTGFSTVHPYISHYPRPEHEGSYLVVSDGEMLLVRVYGSNQPSCMKIFKVDLENGKLIPKKSIGEHALFISCSSNAFSVSTHTFSSIKPDTIYYTTFYTDVYHPMGCSCHPQNNGYLNASRPSYWVQVSRRIPSSDIASRLSLYCIT